MNKKSVIYTAAQAGTYQAILSLVWGDAYMFTTGATHRTISVIPYWAIDDAITEVVRAYE